MSRISSAAIRELRKWALDQGGYDQTTPKDRERYRAKHTCWKSDEQMYTYHKDKGNYQDTVPRCRDWIYEKSTSSANPLSEVQLTRLWEKSEFNGTVAPSVVERIVKRAVKKRKSDGDGGGGAIQVPSVVTQQKTGESKHSGSEEENHQSEEDAPEPVKKKQRTPTTMAQQMRDWLLKKGAAYSAATTAKEKIRDFRAMYLHLPIVPITEQFMNMRTRELFPSTHLSTLKVKWAAAGAAGATAAAAAEATQEKEPASAKPVTASELDRAVLGWLVKSGRVYVHYTDTSQAISDFKKAFAGVLDLSATVISEQYMLTKANEAFPETDTIAQVLSDVHDEFEAAANAISPAVTQSESVLSYQEAASEAAASVPDPDSCGGAMMVNTSKSLPVPIHTDIPAFPPQPSPTVPIQSDVPPPTPSFVSEPVKPAAAASAAAPVSAPRIERTPTRRPVTRAVASPAKKVAPAPHPPLPPQHTDAEKMLTDIEKKLAERIRATEVQKRDLEILKKEVAKKRAEKKLRDERIASTERIKSELVRNRERFEQLKQTLRIVEDEAVETRHWTTEFERLSEELREANVHGGDLQTVTAEYVKTQEAMDRFLNEQSEIHRRLTLLGTAVDVSAGKH